MKDYTLSKKSIHHVKVEKLYLRTSDEEIKARMLKLMVCRSAFQLETMKNGQIIDTVSLAEKSCFKFGRSPGCDVVLEHPSASRLHAVIQFREDNGLPYLYDASSVHGVFINKRRIKPKVYAPLK